MSEEKTAPSNANSENFSDKESGDGSAENQLKNLTEDLQKQVEKFKNDYLYLKAEFENYKRNAIKERADLIKYGSERLLVDLLGVLDNFERALSIEVTPENIETYRQGIEMTEKELKQVLSRFGVNEVTSEGLAFDPTAHEAISSEETDDHPPGHVSKVYRKAYKLHDRLLRPAHVVVAQKKSN